MGCLTGEELYFLLALPEKIEGGFSSGREITVRARRPEGNVKEFQVTCRIDTPQEVLYYNHSSILQYVLRQLLAK